MKSKQIPCPCIRLDTGATFYLINSSEKTLRELGIGAGSRILYLNDASRLKHCPQRSDEGVKPKCPRTRKRHGHRSKGRRKSAQVQAPQKKGPSLEDLKELHSKAMEPVLNELRPKLKRIKQQIDAHSLQKDRPKERKPSTRGKGKENAPNPERSLIPIKDSSGGKAGKTAYPILVGESTDLFKTAQLRPGKALRRITLDLHGFSRYKALGQLRKSLAEWIDVAMKGEYPFVVAVDIICGGGNQVLSEVVAQFIRNSPQIANRPKSIV
ncbi:hypothetical protein ACHAXT_012607 [Thalassiosira profunda]